MTTYLVTGSASGIGAATAERLRDAGATVIGIDLANAEIEADLSQPEGRQHAVKSALQMADRTLTGCVTCAGLGPTVPDFGTIASVNYFGTVEILDGVFPALAKGGGTAVAIASNSAQFGDFATSPFVAALLDSKEEEARSIVNGENGFLAYGGSKHAVARAVRRRAGAWGAAGVRLNAVCPGPVETPLFRSTKEDPIYGEAAAAMEIPVGRTAQPAEIAEFIGYLLGDSAGFIHGSVLYIDGGTDALVRPDQF